MCIELAIFAALCLGLMVFAGVLLSEDERLEDMSERRAVNRMADRSRKAPAGQRRGKYAQACWKANE